MRELFLREADEIRREIFSAKTDGDVIRASRHLTEFTRSYDYMKEHVIEGESIYANTVSYLSALMDAKARRMNR